MIRNLAGQSIGAQMISASSGAAFSGTVTVYITGDAGAQAIGSVGSGLCTLEGNGYYTYRPSADETNFNLIGFTFIGSGAVPQTVQVETVTPSQSSAIALASGSGAVTIRELLRDALEEIGVGDGVSPSEPEDADKALRTFNRLMNSMNADRLAVYCDVIADYALQSGLQPHTFGPTGATFTMDQRPETIEGAGISVNSLFYPMRLRSAQWWAALPYPTISSNYPSDCYYSPGWPLGSLYLYPVLSGSATLRLLTRTVLSGVGLNDTFSMPPGYQDMITMTLAEWLIGPFKVEIPPLLPRRAQRARALVYGANSLIPTLQTLDSGMPGSAGRGWFDYRTGQYQP